MTAETLFSKHAKSLHDRLKGFEIGDYQWLVKGDVSGIQDFIFSVKSEKASKALKGRSFFVQALSKLGIALLQKHLGKGNTDVFYDGGGNFFLLSKVPVTEAISKARTVIDQECQDEEFYLALTEHEIKKEDKFSVIWKAINHQSGIDKLKKFQEDHLSFEPYAHKKYDEKKKDWADENDYEFEELSRILKTKQSPLEVNIAPSGEKKSVDKSGVTFFGSHLTFGGKIEMKDYVIGLPKWNQTLWKKHEILIEKRQKENSEEPIEIGDIIEFSFLADFAKERTGTDKLGILKLDVDNLGKTFENMKDWGAAKNLSEGFSWFFGEFMNRLLDAPFDDGKFSDNLYVVFSGGDDTFIVGAWDAVFEFAHTLRQEFGAFATEMKSKVSPELDLSFSAALLMVGPKFPVIRFAKAAEEALDEAKKWKDLEGKNPKNGISVFGQILRWEEFSAPDSKSDKKPSGAKQLAKEIADMITIDRTSRSIIERIKRVAREYEQLSERAAKGSIPGPKVHRLFYTMRKWKNDLFEDEIKQFSNDLLESFINEKKMKYPKYPVAARWAEFLTRK